jgi:heme exporter protein D
MAEFFSMGGYGLYVWGSYGMTALLMVAEVIWVIRRRRALMQRLSVLTRVPAREQVSDETEA